MFYGRYKSVAEFLFHYADINQLKLIIIVFTYIHCNIAFILSSR